MITLHHCRDARSFRALWALEEIGVAYELKLLPFPPRYRAREYLEINPFGTMPLLIDGATRMTESAAICQYLADRYGEPPLRVLPDEPDYGAYLNALHFGEATLTFPQTIVLRYGQLEPRGAAAAASGGRLRQVDDRPPARPRDLARRRRICGGGAVHGRRHLRRLCADADARLSASGIRSRRRLQAYFERLAARPAFARAKAAQGGDAIF